MEDKDIRGTNKIDISHLSEEQYRFIVDKINNPPLPTEKLIEAVKGIE